MILPPGDDRTRACPAALIVVTAILPEPVVTSVVVPPALIFALCVIEPPEVTDIEPVAVTVPLKVTLVVASRMERLLTVSA